jgi:hypothetical protein
MDMPAIAAIADTLAAIGVLISLIFVGLQIRHNTQAQKVLAVESLTAAIAAINLPGMESPALGDALAKATRDWHAATRDERIIAHFFLFTFFKLLETAWYQRKAHTLDQTQWVGWETMLRVYYHSPGVQDTWWPLRRNGYSPEFQAYLASTSKPAAISTIGDLFDDPKPPQSEDNYDVKH